MRVIETTWEIAPVIMFWLDASAGALAERITSRAHGGGPPLQGDHRLGLQGAALAKAIAAAVEEREHHHLRPAQAQVISTTGLEPAQAAGAIIAALPASALPGQAWLSQLEAGSGVVLV